MHYAGLLGQGMIDAKGLGWKMNDVEHDWDELVSTVKNHVHSLNFAYRVGLMSNAVNYINALAKFEDPHTVSYITKGSSVSKTATAANILIAVGGRPLVPVDIPGAREYAITSDDIFFLNRKPGKTLCVGASYISLECAGFLTELGYDVTVAARSVLLRGFDRQCAEKIGETMSDLGTKFLYECIVEKIVKTDQGRLSVTLSRAGGSIETSEFDTVLFATGRYPDVTGLNLDAAGVISDKSSGKIPVVNEQTNVPHIYALGDVIVGKLELTPVAVHAGDLLAKRLFGGSSKVMDYNLISTAVFTPIEYGSVGLTEEEAVAKHGEDDVDVYLSEFTTLEFAAVHRQKHNPDPNEEFPDIRPPCLSKLIVVKSMGEKVVGFHFVGPNAGEVTQVSRETRDGRVCRT